eukprot:PhM_4_TR13085/c0_g1_i1/m.56732
MIRRRFNIAASVVGPSASLMLHSTRQVHPSMTEPPLDRQANERSRKGPPVAHQLNVYKKVHKLNQSAKWKKANISANAVGGKDLRLRDTHGEGTTDEMGMYRDWVYGSERRYANMIAGTLFVLATGLFFYTVRMLRSDNWDIPAPMLVKPDALKNMS